MDGKDYVPMHPALVNMRGNTPFSLAWPRGEARQEPFVAMQGHGQHQDGGNVDLAPFPLPASP